MTRAHPPLDLSRLAARRALAWAAAAALAGAACNSDDREQFPDTTTSTSEVDPTVVPMFTTGEPMETTSTTEVTPSPKSCRDAIGCALACAIAIPNPTPPEYPWQDCFFTNCLEELSTEEWLKLFELTECVVPLCAATPACMEGTDECNGCYIQKLGGTNPPPAGCEDQANACK